MIITPVISGMAGHLLSNNSFAASSPALPVPSWPGPSGKMDDLEALEEAITQLKQDWGRVGIDIDIHDDSGRIVTRVVDRESGDVIRQIPTDGRGASYGTYGGISAGPAAQGYRLKSP